MRFLAWAARLAAAVALLAILAALGLALGAVGAGRLPAFHR